MGTKPKSSCMSAAKGFGIGVSGGYVAGGGLGPNWSLGGMFSSASGFFYSNGKVTNGGAMTGGAFTTDSGALGNYPANGTKLPNFAAGGFVGRGGSLFVTNAGNVATLYGPFNTGIVAVPAIGSFPGAQIGVDYSDGIFVLSGGLGNMGGGIMSLQTNTFYTTEKLCN